MIKGMRYSKSHKKQNWKTIYFPVEKFLSCKNSLNVIPPRLLIFASNDSPSVGFCQRQEFLMLLQFPRNIFTVHLARWCTKSFSEKTFAIKSVRLLSFYFGQSKLVRFRLKTNLIQGNYCMFWIDIMPCRQ